MSGTFSDKPVRYPHKLTHNTERGSTESDATERTKVLSISKARKSKWLRVYRKPVALTAGQSLAFSALVCDALRSGSSIVCLRYSAYRDLTRWDPYAYQSLQMETYPGQPWLMFLRFGAVKLHPKGCAS